jgi:hypothetical protein
MAALSPKLLQNNLFRKQDGSCKIEASFSNAQGVQQCFGGQENHVLEKMWIERLQVLVPRWIT